MLQHTYSLDNSMLPILCQHVGESPLLFGHDNAPLHAQVYKGWGGGGVSSLVGMRFKPIEHLGEDTSASISGRSLNGSKFLVEGVRC